MPKLQADGFEMTNSGLVLFRTAPAFSIVCPVLSVPKNTVAPKIPFESGDQTAVLLPSLVRSRFNFLREAQIWYNRDPDQRVLGDDFENVIVLSDEFYQEVIAHPALAVRQKSQTIRFKTAAEMLETFGMHERRNGQFPLEEVARRRSGSSTPSRSV